MNRDAPPASPPTPRATESTSPSSPADGADRRRGRSRCGGTGTAGAPRLGLAGRRGRPGGRRRGGHPLPGHHHAGVRAVPVRRRPPAPPRPGCRSAGTCTPPRPIGFDPAAWLHAGLVTNTGIWVQGQPGVGKSTIVKRLHDRAGRRSGCRAVVPGDVKGEYSAAGHALGGRVWRIGRGLHSPQPARRRPAAPALAHTGGDRAASARRDDPRPPAVPARSAGGDRAPRRDRRHRTPPARRRARPAVVDRRPGPGAADPRHRATSSPQPPTAPRCCRWPPAPPTPRTTGAAPATCSTPSGLLCDGAIRGLFDRPSSVTADLDTPALSLDISALDDDDDEVVAAAMLCSWAWAAALIDGYRRASGGAATSAVQDELWRALRVAPGLVERSDRITRLGRHRGDVSIQVTHSLDDLEALPTEADRAKARGMAARNGVLRARRHGRPRTRRARRITPLTDGEARHGHAPGPPRRPGIPGNRHPGRGKYLIKSGDRTRAARRADADPHRTTPLRHRPRLAATRDDSARGAGDGTESDGTGGGGAMSDGPGRPPFRLADIAIPLVMLGAGVAATARGGGGVAGAACSPPTPATVVPATGVADPAGDHPGRRGGQPRSA